MIGNFFVIGNLVVDTALVTGIIGMLFLLSAFILGLISKTGNNSLLYALLNIIGAGFLAYYSLIIKAWPFLILEVAWGLFALYKLIRILVKRK